MKRLLLVGFNVVRLAAARQLLLLVSLSLGLPDTNLERGDKRR